MFCMKLMDLDFILFDMIGTTIQDSNDGTSIILKSFVQAFENNHIPVSYDFVNQQRGKTKRTAIEIILKEVDANLNLVEKVYADFMLLLNQSIVRFQSMPHALDVFQTLKSYSVKVGIGSGLPLLFIKDLLKHLNWDETLFDYVNSSDELDFGRPHPIMIQDAMDKLDLPDPHKILKVGDTLVDILEGKAAGVKTAMVLTGTQSVQDLGDVEPDYVCESIRELSLLSF